MFDMGGVILENIKLFLDNERVIELDKNCFIAGIKVVDVLANDIEGFISTKENNFLSIENKEGSSYLNKNHIIQIKFVNYQK